MKRMLRNVALVTVAGLFTVSGCLIVDHHDDENFHGDDGHHHDGGVGTQPTDPFYTTIDRDKVLSTELGQGAGMFVEYTAGGVWNVWTSCDSDQSGALCFWQAEIFVHDGAIDSFEGNELEEFDSVGPTEDGGLSVYFETGSFSDAVTFTTEPGALVEMVVALDGVTAPQYFVWYGNNEVQDGAPRSPVVFQPDAP